MLVYTPLSITKPENFIDPEANKNAYKDQNVAMIRVLASVKTPIGLQVFAPDSEQPLKLDDSLSTWEHLCLFESQLVPSDFLKSSYRLQTYVEWLSKFKFGRWQLADMDNWMEGNPLVERRAREGYKQEIFKGSKYDRSVTINIKET